ncbi:MAG: hypothetical protein HYZ23_10805, partial [Chloroflexi bacterium]|nr:hypothetical protein [Chloroflexota bacterium]
VVWGVTDWAAAPDHHLQAKVNGVTVGDDIFDGLTEKVIKFDLPAGTLREGENTLELTLPGDTGVRYDLINFDKFSVAYQRSFAAKDGQLIFTAAGKAFTVTGLPTQNIVVYRVDEKGLARLGKVVIKSAGAGYSVSFAGSNRPAKYMVSTVETLAAPGMEATRLKVNLDNPAQYLIIAHPDFIAGIQPLAQARQAEGYTVSVVDVNDLYAQYNYGIFDPQAIKDYIKHAAQSLGTEYVLLVGGDTYDYRNFLGRNSVSFIPSLYISTGPIANFVPADPLYADIDGNNAPDLAIGRFPVRTQAELDIMVKKTLDYASKDYGYTSIFVSDLDDGLVSYKQVNQQLAAGMPSGWQIQNIDLDDTSVSTARQQLLASMNGGTALVTFTGHSGLSAWTFSGLFNTSHAASLTNAGRPFVAVQWGCWNTYYVDPVNNYLVHSLLVSGDKGAAAVLGASTLTDSESERQLGLLFTPLMTTPGMPIGSALQQAKAELALAHPELLDVLLGWSLMGDPALVVQP